MEDKKKKIKEILDVYLEEFNISNKPSDVFIDLKIDEQIQFIFNFCNIDELPNELIYTVAMRSLGDLLALSNSQGSEDSTGDIKQISEGDTTVSFSNASESLTFEQIKKYQMYGQHLLMNFRKLKW